MHVLSLCICYIKSQCQEWILKLFWFLRETSLSSSQCQQEHQWKCQCLRGNWSKADTFRRKCRLSFLRHAEVDSNKNFGMWCFSFSFCLSVWLPVCLSLFSTLTAESTSRAKLESSCQSKLCFSWDYCSHYDHVNDALDIFNLDILLHIITSEGLFRSMLYISLVSSIICDDIQKQSYVSVCVCHLYKLQIAEKD